MLNKICGLARALYIVLAIVAGFIALGGMDVALVLVALGLVSGIVMASDKYVPSAATVIALPIIGAALAHVPTIGDKLAAIAGNLQLGIAGALASALAIVLYQLVMDGVMGLTGAEAGGRAAAATAK